MERLSFNKHLSSEESLGKAWVKWQEINFRRIYFVAKIVLEPRKWKECSLNNKKVALSARALLAVEEAKEVFRNHFDGKVVFQLRISSDFIFRMIFAFKEI